MKKKLLRILTFASVVLALGLLIIGIFRLNIVLIGAGSFVLIMNIKELSKAIKSHD